MDKDIVFEIRNLDKSFPGVKALNGISLDIKRGEVHGLVGENGAGKSTLIKILTGVYTLSSGEVNYYHDGKALHITDPLQGKQNGISTVYQDLMIAADLSVAENFFLSGAPKNKFGLVDWKKMYGEAARILSEYDMGFISPRIAIKELTVSQQAMISIVKIANEHADVVIFDEPTALLPNEDVDKLFSVIRKMKQEGTSIIYISHRLEEVLQICDVVTVLKDGELVSTLPIDGLSEDRLVSLMVGRDVDVEDMFHIDHPQPGPEVLRVDKLSKKGVFEDISFELRKGEVVGFFGLVGSGRTEIMRCIYGADPITSGDIYVNDKKANIRSVSDAFNLKMGLIPEDRRQQGLALPLTLSHNINISDYDTISKYFIVNRKKEEKRAKEYMEKLNIKAYSTKQIVRNLSGGNQQKVVLSKVLCKGGDIIIMDEPTVGVDVGAKKEIYNLIGRLINEGKSILFVSSYLPEVIGVSDRVNVMCEGRLTGTVTKDEMKRLGEHDAEELIMKYASKVERG